MATTITPDAVVLEFNVAGALFAYFETAQRGAMSLAEKHLRTMLSQSAEFQTWTGTADATQARNRIWHDALPRRASGTRIEPHQLSQLRPFALISTIAFRGDHFASDGHHRFIHGGVLQIQLEQDIPAAILNNRQEEHVQFMNRLAVVMDEMEDLTGTAGNLAFSGVSMPEPWSRNHEDEVKYDGGEVQMAQIMIEWEQQA